MSSIILDVKVVYCNWQEFDSLCWDKTFWWPFKLQDLLSHHGLQPDLEWLFKFPPLLSSVSDGSRRPACVFVEPPQQAVAGAISASFTGGTA